jgi:hypothetical protein
VRVLRGTVGDGGRVLEVGERLPLPDREARYLVSLGKAEFILAPTDAAAPVPVHRDPAPSRARGSRS